jgi:hypothetical protein
MKSFSDLKRERAKSHEDEMKDDQHETEENDEEQDVATELKSRRHTQIESLNKKRTSISFNKLINEKHADMDDDEQADRESFSSNNKATAALSSVSLANLAQHRSELSDMKKQKQQKRYSQPNMSRTTRRVSFLTKSKLKLNSLFSGKTQDDELSKFDVKPSKPLPLVKFDPEGDFSKEALNSTLFFVFTFFFSLFFLPVKKLITKLIKF